MAQRIAKFLLLIITIVLSVSCAAAHPKAKTPLPLTTLHKTVYIDEVFNIWQRSAIEAGLNAWQCSTNGVVNFDVQADNHAALKTNPLLIEKVNSSDPRVVSSQAEIEKKRPKGEEERFVIGLYTLTSNGTPIILVVDDRLHSYDEYRSLSEHEIVHALSAPHSSNENSIMFRYMDKSPKHITEDDLGAFCALYWCDAEEMRVCY